MKKIVFITMLASFVFVGGIFFIHKKTSYADTTTYYIDPSGTDDMDHGTASGTDAWATIQFAISNVPNPDSDTITIYISGDTYTTNNDDIDIDRDFIDLTLEGSGIDSTIIQPHADPNSATQGNFDIGWGETVTLKNMTIRYGKVGSVSGGGIAMDGTSLTLDTVKISENTTTSSPAGGAMYAPYGNITIINSIISDNQSTSSGVAGLYLTGDDIYINTTVIDNNDSSSGLGGVSISSATSFLMENSTLSNSDTTAYTAGLNLSGNGTIKNSTFYDNNGDNVGALNISSSTLTIVNSTFYKGGGSFANLMVNNGGTVYIKNCLLADREQGSDFYKGTSGTVYDGGYNLVETSGSFTFSATGDITGNQENLNVSPFISTNGNTNNSTQTIAILTASPAIDAGDNADYNGVSIPTTDQRGKSRYGTLDIGAYEAQEIETADPYISSTSLDEDNGYADVTFNEAVYTTSGGSGALEASDFSVAFVQGIGGATGATITSVTKTDFGALSGGETIVRINFTVDGTANGVETVEFTPTSSTAIYDTVGNPMTSNQTTGAITLNGHFDYYVDASSGDDANTGGSGDPWQTIQHAIDNMVSPTATNNIIHLAEGVYTTNNDDIDIGNYMQDLTIQGSGANDTIIQPHTDPASATVGNFDIEYYGTVTIKDVTIRYGRGSTSGNGIAFGSGNLTVQNVILDDNDSSSGIGGVSVGSSTTFLMENSTLSNSDSPGYTAGMNISGTTIIKNSTFYDNTGSNVGSINVSSSSYLTVINSTFYKGGGSFANVMVNNGGYMYMKNCLLADRELGSDFYKGSSGTIYDGGYNLVETSGSFTFNATGDIAGDQPSLNIDSTLAYNSSEHNTQTLALSTGSVAINAGDSASYNNVEVPLTDQRGAARNGAVDIGAYEFEGYISAPTISTLYPVDDATGVSESSNLIIEFSEVVDAESGNISIYDSEGTLFEQFDVTSDISGSGTDTIIINPSTNFAGLTSYYIQIDASAFDDSGSNSFAGISDDSTWSFTTGDEIAPEVSTFFPENGATGMAVDSNLSVSFNENVDAESGNISIYDSEGTLFEQFDVTSEITGSGTNTITLNPSSNFEEQTTYYIQIDASAFDDSSSNSFSGITNSSTWRFTTGDFTDPFINTFSPENGAEDVEMDQNMVLTFTESVDVESGNIVLYKEGGIVVETIAVTSEKVTGSGSQTITVNPTEDLESGQSYYIMVDATAFDDSSGNSFAGITNSTAWAFTVGDFTNPTVSSLSPANNAIDIAVNANLVITFLEAIDIETGNITIYKASDDSVVEVIDVTSNKVSGSGTTTITINPENNFESETAYYVQVAATAFDDSSSNSFAGILDESTWSFTSADIKNPYVLTYAPEDDALAVDSSTNLVLTFSEDITAGTGNVTLYASEDDSVVEVIDITSDRVVFSGPTVTIDPEVILGSELYYYIMIDSGAVVDEMGNQYPGINDEVTWNFTSEDTMSPTINSMTPTDNSTNIAIDTDLTIQFSEEVQKNSGNIHIYNAETESEIQSIDVNSSSVSGEGTQNIVIDISALSNGTSYYILLDQGIFVDDSNNIFAGIIGSQTAWNFTTIASTESDQQESNEIDNDTVIEESTTDTSNDQCFYTVISGDTLWSIANKTIGNGSQYQTIIDLNKVAHPNIESSLSVGWKLIVPCTKTSTSTAKRTNTTQVSQDNEDQEPEEDEVSEEVKDEQEVKEYQEPEKRLQDANDTSLPIVHSQYDVTIRLHENGKPLAGVEVELHSNPRQGITDENGVVIFKNVEPGQHTVKIAHASYMTEESIYVAGEDKAFNLHMDVELKQRWIPTWAWITAIFVGIGGIGFIGFKKRQISLKKE